MLIFSKKAYLKIKYYTQQAEGEISGLGKTRMTEENNIIIENVEIFPQEASDAFTELSEEAMAKFLYEKTKKKEDVSGYNLWWHTHNDFNTFWSGTDTHTINESSSSTFLISVVVNKDMDIKARMDLFKPFRYTFPLEVFRVKDISHNKKLKRSCKNKIDLCVKKPEPITIQPDPFLNDPLLNDMPLDTPPHGWSKVTSKRWKRWSKKKGWHKVNLEAEAEDWEDDFQWSEERQMYLPINAKTKEEKQSEAFLHQVEKDIAQGFGH